MSKGSDSVETGKAAVLSAEGYDRGRSLMIVALSVLIPVVISLILRYVFQGESYGTEAETVNQWFLNNIIGVCNSTTKLVIPAALGYILTKSRHGAIVLIAVAALGCSVGDLLADFFDVAVRVVFQLPEGGFLSSVSVITTVISTVVSLIVSCLIYRALVAESRIASVTEEFYRSARKRLVVSYIIAFIMQSVFSSGILIVGAFVLQEAEMSWFNAAINVIIAVPFYLVIYFSGYDLKKDTSDGLKMLSCYFLSVRFANFVLVVLILLSGTFANFTGMASYMADMSGTDSLSMLTVISSGSASFVSIVFEIIVMLWSVKYLFPPESVSEAPFEPREVRLTGKYSDIEDEQN